jgi:hypothetical protein
VAWNCWRLGCADLYVEQEVRPRASGEKRSRGSTALLALDAELGFQRNCARTRVRESRLKRRNLGTSVFPEMWMSRRIEKFFCVKQAAAVRKSARSKTKTPRGATEGRIRALGPELCGGQASDLAGWVSHLRGSAGLGNWRGLMGGDVLHMGNTGFRSPIQSISFADWVLIY